MRRTPTGLRLRRVRRAAGCTESRGRWTAVMFAALDGHADIISMLVAAGADMCAECNGRSPSDPPMIPHREQGCSANTSSGPRLPRCRRCTGRRRRRRTHDDERQRVPACEAEAFVRVRGTGMVRGGTVGWLLAGGRRSCGRRGSVTRMRPSCLSPRKPTSRRGTPAGMLVNESHSVRPLAQVGPGPGCGRMSADVSVRQGHGAHDGGGGRAHRDHRRSACRRRRPGPN